MTWKLCILKYDSCLSLTLFCSRRWAALKLPDVDGNAPHEEVESGSCVQLHLTARSTKRGVGLEAFFIRHSSQCRRKNIVIKKLSAESFQLL